WKTRGIPDPAVGLEEAECWAGWLLPGWCSDRAPAHSRQRRCAAAGCPGHTATWAWQAAVGCRVGSAATAERGWPRKADCDQRKSAFEWAPGSGWAPRSTP